MTPTEMSSELSQGERSVLFHTLGLDYGRTIFRNHFVAGPGYHDGPYLASLMEKGFLALSGIPSFIPREDQVYHATDEGKAFALVLSEAMEPKLTRDQRRYRLYRECDSDLSFGAWLRSAYWKRERKARGC